MKKVKERISTKNPSNNSGDPTAIMNNDETSDNRFIHNNNKNSIILDYNDSFSNLSLEETFILRYSDPINTISLTDNYLLFGTMIGKAILYNISKKHFYQLYDLTNENIMGSSLENKINDKNVHYIAIGDESAVSVFEKENEQDVEANTIYNYEQKDNHNITCAESFTLLWKNKSLIINLANATQYNEEIEFKKNSYLLLTYEIEEKKKDLIDEGSIEMSNFSVPFDFKYNIFLFLEHHPQDKRAICTYEFMDKTEQNNDIKKEKKIITLLDKNFGHISFMKIISKNLILLVRNYNLIEVYDIEKEFKPISSYNNKSELNAIDFYEVKTQEEDENDDNIVNANLKLRIYNIIFIDIDQNIVELKYKHELSGGNSKFEKMEINFKINVNNIEGISEELKMKGLFDLDFPYYIKNSPNYIALTTDQACFLFKKQR